MKFLDHEIAESLIIVNLSNVNYSSIYRAVEPAYAETASDGQSSIELSTFPTKVGMLYPAHSNSSTL